MKNTIFKNVDLYGANNGNNYEVEISKSVTLKKAAIIYITKNKVVVLGDEENRPNHLLKKNESFSGEYTSPYQDIIGKSTIEFLINENLILPKTSTYIVGTFIPFS